MKCQTQLHERNFFFLTGAWILRNEIQFVREQFVSSYRDLCLSESRWNVEVLRDHNVSKVVLKLNAPNRQPVDVVHGQVSRQNDFYVRSLITT